MNLKEISNRLFMPVHTTNLAIFRIGIALIALIQYTCLREDLLDIFGKYGYLQETVMDTILPAYQPRLSWIQDLLRIPDSQEVMFIQHTHTAFLIGCFLLMLGFWTRWMALFCLCLQICFMGTSYAYCYGFDYFMCSSFFYCVFFPVGLTHSLDAIFAKNRKQEDYFFYTFWLRVHLGCIYFFSGLGKSLGSAWWNGEALWRSVMSLEFKTMDVSFIAQVPLAVQMLCWFTLIMELFYPIGINWKRTRTFWLVSIVLLHIGIILFMGLWFFGSIMILWNIVAYGTFSERVHISFPKIYEKWRGLKILN